MTTSYEKRLAIPIEGNPDTIFKTESGTVVAKGYERIVIGGRGPYVEFTEAQIVKDAIVIPENMQWRLSNGNSYYDEWRTTDESNVKLYQQKKTVDYADYKVGFWYITPFALWVDGKVLIEPLRKKV